MKIGLIVFGILILAAIYSVWSFSFPIIELVGFELNFLFWSVVFLGKAKVTISQKTRGKATNKLFLPFASIAIIKAGTNIKK